MSKELAVNSYDYWFKTRRGLFSFPRYVDFQKDAYCFFSPGEKVWSDQFDRCNLLISGNGEPNSPILFYHALPINRLFPFGYSDVSHLTEEPGYFHAINHALSGSNPWIFSLGRGRYYDGQFFSPMDLYLQLVTRDNSWEALDKAGWNIDDFGNIKLNCSFLYANCGAFTATAQYRPRNILNVTASLNSWSGPVEQHFSINTLTGETL